MRFYLLQRAAKQVSSNMVKYVFFHCFRLHNSKHPVQVLRWPSNFIPEINPKFKVFSGKIYQKLNSPASVDFPRGS